MRTAPPPTPRIRHWDVNPRLLFSQRTHARILFKAFYRELTHHTVLK